MRKWFRSNLKGLASVPAVYVVLRNNDNIPSQRPLYVGQTNDLKRRFSPHHLQFKKLHHRAIVVFSIRETEAERLALERRLIRRLNPLGNTHRSWKAA